MTTLQAIQLRVIGFLVGTFVGLVVAAATPGITNVATTARFLGFAWLFSVIGFSIAVIISHVIRHQERQAKALRPKVIAQQESPKRPLFYE